MCQIYLIMLKKLISVKFPTFVVTGYWVDNNFYDTAKLIFDKNSGTI